MPKFTNLKVSLTLPFIGNIEGNWEPDESECQAAWEMYVELVTRGTVVKLGADEGLLHEVLDSMYSLFETTRNILRKYGPNIAQPKGRDQLSFGFLAVMVLNTVLRPLLSKWHPLLQNHEDIRPHTLSPVVHERNWEYYDALRQEIEDARFILVEYADILADVAGVPSLIVEIDQKEQI